MQAPIEPRGAYESSIGFFHGRSKSTANQVLNLNNSKPLVGPIEAANTMIESKMPGESQRSQFQLFRELLAAKTPLTVKNPLIT